MNVRNVVNLHACTLTVASPLVDGRVNNVLLQTGPTLVNEALLQLISTIHIIFLRLSVINTLHVIIH